MTARIEDPIRRVWREENERLTEEFLDRAARSLTCLPAVCLPPSKAVRADVAVVTRHGDWVLVTMSNLFTLRL